MRVAMVVFCVLSILYCIAALAYASGLGTIWIIGQ